MTEPETKTHHTTEERRRAIAAAARSLIVEKGFEGLRTRDIADRVGINIATLHYHVPSKEVLIGLVAQSMRDEFVAQHLSHPRDGLDPVARLKLEFEEYRETCLHNPDLLAVMEELSRRATHDPNIACHLAPMKARWRQEFVDILTEGKAAGLFRADLDPEAGAAMIIGAMVVFRARPEETLNRLYDRVVAEILRSVLSDKTKGYRHD